MIHRLTILGVGLIGGSWALALKEAGAVGEVVGWGRDAARLGEARALGVIDRVEQDLARAMAGAELAVVATPISVMPELFERLAALPPDDTVVTDVGSVKGEVVRMARAGLGARFARFVPGHPVAGDEKTGAAAARADLFRGHRVVLTPVPETDAGALALVRRLWEAAGAEVVDMDAVRHDRLLAATSHLPHVLAYALVDCLAGGEGGDEILRYAAGGFRDLTRIASSDPVMWRDICLANRGELLAVLDAFEARLRRVRGMIEAGEGDALGELFGRAKAARDRFCSK